MLQIYKWKDRCIDLFINVGISMKQKINIDNLKIFKKGRYIDIFIGVPAPLFQHYLLLLKKDTVQNTYYSHYRVSR